MSTIVLFSSDALCIDSHVESVSLRIPKAACHRRFIIYSKSMILFGQVHIIQCDSAVK